MYHTQAAEAFLANFICKADIRNVFCMCKADIRKVYCICIILRRRRPF